MQAVTLVCPAAADIIGFLSGCQAASGGFGGGPCQLAHLAPTYAAVASLVSLGEEDALRAVNRPALLSFVQRMCVPAEQGGGLSICQGASVQCAMETMTCIYNLYFPCCQSLVLISPSSTSRRGGGLPRLLHCDGHAAHAGAGSQRRPGAVQHGVLRPALPGEASQCHWGGSACLATA